MKKITFERSQDSSHYSPDVDEREGGTWCLGHFLSDDVTDLSFVERWIKKSNVKNSSFDFATLKFSGDMVEVGCEFLEKQPSFLTPISTLQKIARGWSNISASGAPYIILALHDDGSFEFSTSQTKPKE